jgi:hypothetical protein
MAGSTFWKEKTISGRKIGDEYLNSEFGWKPLISDVTDIISAVSHARSVLEQYERASGSLVRRRYSFPISYSTVTTDVAGSGVIFQDHPTFHTPGRAMVTKLQKEVWKQTWFSGAFTYHLPTGYKSHSKIMELGAKADALLGTDLTPEVLWNIAPWSWAVDWFSNAGDVISNLSSWATDGLVMKWGYIMEKTISKNTYYQIDEGTKSTSIYDSHILGTPIVASVETKQRRVASPFGFGLDFSSLTSRQKAIIAALGITRRK